ncbi:hypothetical protein AB3331_08405 [Streptococcus sp. H49]|uniref:hypothetical protein n=1 Tax=Streptococcus huangxiaojuni TaxID=3237239 RepID=UPI0034A1714D
MEKLLKIGNSVFFVLMILWGYFAVYFAFQYLNIDYTDLTDALAKLLIAFVILLFFAFHFKKQTVRIGRIAYSFLISHKKYVLAGLFAFQLLITFSSLALASADTSTVYLIATDPRYAAVTDYISVNPNNFLLVVWFKINYFLTRESLVAALTFWNILFIDSSIVFVYLSNKLMLNKKTADVSFLLFTLVLGLSPQQLYTYSDAITLFLLSLFILLAVLIVKGRLKARGSAFAGLVLAAAYGFRPTVMIFIIAGAIVLTVYAVKQKKAVLKSYVKVLLIAVCSFILVNRALAFSLEKQDFVNYEPQMSRTLLYYVNLGLTYSGNVHSEVSEEVWQSAGKDRNRLALNEIKQRLADYKFTTFVGHLFYKYYWIVGEGNFGWFQERVLSEEQRLTVQWLKNIQDSALARWIRSYIYVEGDNYYLYGSFLQIIWIGVSVGLIAFCFFFDANNGFQLWMQITVFGGLLFLMLFEGGRTRYLIQFLPAILTISSVGIHQLNRLLNQKISEQDGHSQLSS